ncbi:hypothetical protein ACU686_05810 [Yinghuangia aomiensis]
MRGLVLAVLLGVNIGPNLTYAGSLATLLWRRIVTDRGTAGRPRLGVHPPRRRRRPATLTAAVVALWAALAVVGT